MPSSLHKAHSCPLNGVSAARHSGSLLTSLQPESAAQDKPGALRGAGFPRARSLNAGSANRKVSRLKRSAPLKTIRVKAQGCAQTSARPRLTSPAAHHYAIKRSS
uniref:Uncharacterized protein n=1 Tax=Knipowitschia caucasica TaxID=637954 RepID=A0AAV2KUN7_KNICA